MAHSRIGASTCERWWNCPGSVALVAKMPKQLPSPYADEGTVAHLIGEWCLRTGRDAVEFVGQKANEIISGDERYFAFHGDERRDKSARRTGNSIEVTDEMAEAVQIYLEAIRFDMETHGLTVDNINIEQKFHLVEIDKDAFGTNDCSLPLFLDRIIVYDYKHGKGVTVDVEENKQLMYYALGAAQDGGYEMVEIVIVQPRAAHKDGPIRRYTLTIDELRAFGEELKVRIKATKDPNAQIIDGPWCKFCPAMAICPVMRKSVENKAIVAFADSPIIQAKRPEEMSAIELRNMMDAMPLIEAWLKSIEAYAESQANAGKPVLGYKLVRGAQGHRKWGVPEEEVVETLSLEVEVYEKKLKSVPEIEKELGKKRFKELTHLVTRPEGKIILVPESDPREAVEPNATKVFGQLE